MLNCDPDKFRPAPGEFVDPDWNIYDTVHDWKVLNGVDKAPTVWKHKICVIGATGAVGRQIVDKCLARSNVGEITVIVRRKLP